MKIRLEDGCQYQQCCHLYHAVFDRRDAQRSLAAIARRNVNPPHRTGSIRLGLQFLLHLLKPLVAGFRCVSSLYRLQNR